MKTQSIDTNPETERVLISLIRKVSLSKKLSQTLSFSHTTIQLSKRAIARANKNLDIDQIKEQNPLKNSSYSIVRENSEKWIWNIFRDKRHSNKK